MLRRLQLLVLVVILLVAAFSTGWGFLFFLVYLGLLIGGGSYILTRLGLADLEAGYAVSQLTGHVGDRLRVTYTLRNTGRAPKPWLEVHNPTSLPGGLPGRALSLGVRQERSWMVRLQFTRRGHFRIDPLQIRTGDPFGFFEAAAGVGHGVTLVVYPRIDALPLWRLPPANIEGSHASPERTLQTTPLATTVRPYAPGDSMNRIHWRSTARTGEIQVKEFELEQTTDAWLFLDMDEAFVAGEGDESTTEVAVRAAASIADKALEENRAVGISVNGHRLTVLTADRGARQRLKILQLLAAVEADGRTPLDEALIAGIGRLRRGMTAIVITASQDPSFIRPLAALRARGVGTVVLHLDPAAFAPVSAPDADGLETQRQRARALRHALAEYELTTYMLRPDRSLGRVPGSMSEEPVSERRLGRPAEGWLTVGMVLVIVLVLAWAIDDPAWVAGNQARTDGLVLFALLGMAVGLIGPKVGWGRWTTHVIGALLAGLLIPVFAGWAFQADIPAGEAFRLTAEGTTQAYLDIARRGRQFTTQEIHYVLVLGALIWGTAQFVAYAVFGHRRPARRRDDRRHRPGREHGAHESGPVGLPHHVRRRVAVPAHRDACVR